MGVEKLRLCLLSPIGVGGLFILMLLDLLILTGVENLLFRLISGFGVFLVLLSLTDLLLVTGVDISRDHVDADLVLVFGLSEYLIDGLTKPVFLFLKDIILFNRCGVFEGVLQDVILLFSIGLNIGEVEHVILSSWLTVCSSYC